MQIDKEYIESKSTLINIILVCQKYIGVSKYWCVKKLPYLGLSIICLYAISYPTARRPVLPEFLINNNYWYGINYIQIADKCNKHIKSVLQLNKLS